ncbi:hypothetical protein P3S67_032357 [Capsicum chacoense]
MQVRNVVVLSEIYITYPADSGKVQKYNVTNIFVSHGLEDCRLEDVELLYVLRLYILQIGTSRVQSLLAVSPLHLLRTATEAAKLQELLLVFRIWNLCCSDSSKRPSSVSDPSKVVHF